jgi:hypothetical protein
LVGIGEGEQVILRLVQVGEGGVDGFQHGGRVGGSAHQRLPKGFNGLITQLLGRDAQKVAEASVHVVQSPIGEDEDDAFLNAVKDGGQLLKEFALAAQKLRPLHDAAELGGEGLKEGEVSFVESA